MAKAAIPVYTDHGYEMISVYENTSGAEQDAMTTAFLHPRCLPRRAGRAGPHGAARADRGWRLRLLTAVIPLLALACTAPPRWMKNDAPTQQDLATLLGANELKELYRDISPAEVPELPRRTRLRPCCAFGVDLRVKVGAIPVPGYEIGNLRGPADLGRHTYDSGAMTLSPSPNYS